jgi:hypothetical protein
MQNKKPTTDQYIISLLGSFNFCGHD